MEVINNQEVAKQALLFISTGARIYHRQTVFSILSAVWFIEKSDKKDIQIVLYTDNTDFAELYLGKYKYISIIQLTEKTIKEWKGMYDYIFRIKIMAILDMLNKGINKLCYFDGDIFFREDPSRLFDIIDDQHAVMYMNEGQLSDESYPNWDIIRKKLPSLKLYFGNERVIVDYSDCMWNAGVVGISCSSKQIVEKVKDLTDQYCSQTNDNAYHQDQLMFSVVLSRELQLISAECYGIYHYCYEYQKEHGYKIINRFFKEIKRKREGLLDKVHEISYINVIMSTPLPVPFYKFPAVFVKHRLLGISMAIGRVKKSGSLKSFFDRGKTY